MTSIYFLLLRVYNAGGKTLSDFMRLSFLSSRRPFGENAFDAVRQCFRNFLCVRISSDKSRPATDYDKFANSILFNLSYNLDSPLVRQQSLDEMLSRRRIVRLRTQKLSPRRSQLTETGRPQLFLQPSKTHKTCYLEGPYHVFARQL